MRIIRWVPLLLLVAVGCEATRPPPERVASATAKPAEDAGALARAPLADPLANASDVVGFSEARPGDWVEYRVESAARSRSTLSRREGTFRVTVVENDGARLTVLLSSVDATPPGALLVTAPTRPKSISRRKTFRDGGTLEAAGRSWRAVVGSYDGSAWDGPVGEEHYAVKAPMLAAGWGLLSRIETDAGPGGYGRSSLQLTAFGHDVPPSTAGVKHEENGDGDLPLDFYGLVIPEERSTPTTPGIPESPKPATR